MTNAIKILPSWFLMLGFTFLGILVLAVSIGWVAMDNGQWTIDN